MTRSRPILALALAALAAGPHCAQAQLAITYTDTQPLPSDATDQHGDVFTVTGLSGITWLGGNTYAAVMDNSDKLLRFELSLDTDGSVLSLGSFQGLTLAAAGDHEAIAPRGPTSVLIANEAAMTIREFSLADGSVADTWRLPDPFSQRRGNLGIESLTLDPAITWTANEEALQPDGPRATPDNGTTVRLARLRTADGFPLSQHAYTVEPMHGPRFPFGNPGQSGLSDLVALPDGSLLALERSLALATPLFLTRIYEVGFAGAADVSQLPALDGAPHTPTTKRLVYQGDHNNLEGLCLGPRLSPTTHALLGVVDDGDPVSSNALVVLVLQGLDATPADTNADGRVDIDDLHHLHKSPQDLNGDGLADADDRRSLERFLRRHEQFESLTREE